MNSLLPVLPILACPLGMAAMMAIPAAAHRHRRRRNPAGGAPPAGLDAHVPAHHAA